MRGKRLSLFLDFLFFNILLCLGLQAPIRSEAGAPFYTGSPFPVLDPRGVSPHEGWKQSETQHFVLIFPEPLSSRVSETARLLEEAHQLLAPVLKWEPRLKTTVLLLDNRDSANGVTAPVLRIGITLWLTPPESWHSTRHYDDWLRLLILHEYSHFLNIDPTRGLFAAARWIIGDVPLPNNLWTPWMLEGLAVFMETEFTSAGRGRGSIYEMTLRTAVDAGVFNTDQFVTLGQMSGNLPYFPGGDTRYLLGYYLMQQLVKSAGPKKQADSILGQLSEASSHFTPSLYEALLAKVSKKSWADLWEDFAHETTSKMQAEISEIKASPLSPVRLLSTNTQKLSQNQLGSAKSPDGKWIAYGNSSTELRPSLMVVSAADEKAKAPFKISDKAEGVSIAFSPDSTTVFFSQLIQEDNYTLTSELTACHLPRRSCQVLTENLRAKDPDVSQDGTRITFTISEEGTNTLAIANLVQIGDGNAIEYQVKKIQKLYKPSFLDHIGTPKFAHDGKKIYFSLHPNGKHQEDLLEIDLTRLKTKTLVSDGSFNSFPTVDSDGSVYYISDRGGVSNLYRYTPQGSERLTNVVSGLNAPASRGFTTSASKRYVLSSFFTPWGWTLAEVELAQSPFFGLPLKQQPKESLQSPPKTGPLSPQIQDYSPFKSLFPRAWAPLLALDAEIASLGAETGGFDDLNIHRYLLGVGHTPKLAESEGFVFYSNRGTGADLRFNVGSYLGGFDSDPSASTFYRETDFSVSAIFPKIWTYSSLGSAISLSAQKFHTYSGLPGFTQMSLVQSSAVVPNLDLSVQYSETETSILSVSSAEKGHSGGLGIRSYLFPDLRTQWKGFAYFQKFFNLGSHWVVRPLAKLLWASDLDSFSPFTAAQVQGRSSSSILGGLSGDGVSQLSLRGYPNRTFISKSAAALATELRFPIYRIFTGPELIPLFLEQFYGFAFLDATAFPSSSKIGALLSAGSGVRFSTEILNFLSFTFSGEFHYGFDSNWGGKPDFFLQINLGSTYF